MATVKLEIITPSKKFYSGEVELVIARTLSGDEGFMAGHAWACKLLDVDALWIREAESSEFRVAALAGGYIDVKDTIIIYTDAAEWQEEIDKERAKAAKEAVEQWLKTEKEHDPNKITRAQITLSKAISRMKIADSGNRR